MSDHADTNTTAHGNAGDGTKSATEQWRRAIEIVTRSLQARLGATVDPALIKPEVEAEFAAYSQATVRDFIPILVEARVRSRLSGSAEPPAKPAGYDRIAPNPARPCSASTYWAGANGALGASGEAHT